MSCFGGKMKEYPSISVDCFTKENLESLAFFLSHCHKDHMDGLDSVAFSNVLQSSSSKMIYCSDTTRNLSLCNPVYSHLEDYLVGIPIDQPYLVTLHDSESNKREVISVTLLSAGHCVGSVMFLFEGSNGNVLYTGDFRLAKGDVQRIKLLHTNGRVKDVKSIYIDTTFCLPKMMTIPSRKATRDAIIRIIDRWISRGSTYMVNLLCKGMYGYEYILKEIAQHYKTKIHVSKERLALYQYLTDMSQYFTTDPGSTFIHSCRWNKLPKEVQSSLPCGFTPPNGMVPNTIKIKPSTMWFARRSHPLPAENSIYCKDTKTWRVVHSMHASMEEIIDLVSYIKPYHVFPNVEPAGLYTVDDAWEWLKQYTRVNECDSCGQEDSGQSNFQSMATKFKFAAGIGSTTGISTIKRSSPSDQVVMCYKELGLEEDVSLAPLPSKRRRKARKSAGSHIVNDSNNPDLAERRDFDNENATTPCQNDASNSTALIPPDNAKTPGSIPSPTDKLPGSTPGEESVVKEESSFQEGTSNFYCYRSSEFKSDGKTSPLTRIQSPTKRSASGPPDKASLSRENPSDPFKRDVCEVSCRGSTDLVVDNRSVGGRCLSEKRAHLSISSSADMRAMTSGTSHGETQTFSGSSVGGDKTFEEPLTGNATEAPLPATHLRASRYNVDSTTNPSLSIVSTTSKSNVKSVGNIECTTRPLASVYSTDRRIAHKSIASTKGELVGCTVSSYSDATAQQSAEINQPANASSTLCTDEKCNANDTDSPAGRSANPICTSTSLGASVCIDNDSDSSDNTNQRLNAFDIPASPGVCVPTQDELAVFYKQLENGDFQA